MPYKRVQPVRISTPSCTLRLSTTLTGCKQTSQWEPTTPPSCTYSPCLPPTVSTFTRHLTGYPPPLSAPSPRHLTGYFPHCQHLHPDISQLKAS